MMLQETVQLELFAKQLYETTNPAARAEVEKTLVQFAAAPDCLNKCQLLLERAAVCLSVCIDCTLLVARLLILPVPEETFTHSHLSWSSIVPYLLHTSTIHDPWHPPCSVLAPDNLFPQSVSNLCFDAVGWFKFFLNFYSP